jgi:catechol 2,3-dioxygenase-like lactoylglutathione lyase family enzyme
MDMKLEIVVVPVSDVDGAKRFYEVLGWRLDADFATGPEFRVVQFTPPGSAASIIFGKGITPLRRERSKASTSWCSTSRRRARTSQAVESRFPSSSTTRVACSITRAPPDDFPGRIPNENPTLPSPHSMTPTGTAEFCRRSGSDVPGVARLLLRRDVRTGRSGTST